MKQITMGDPRITVPLWEHQKEMIEFARGQFKQRGYCWWLAGCSTGKTLAAYALAAEHNKTLVVTLKNVIPQAWKNDISMTEGLDVMLLTGGSTVQKTQEIENFITGLYYNPRVVVTNYEAAAKMHIDDWDFDLVVFDESHKLMSHNSKQSKALALACKNIPHKLLMTGTGWEDRPTNVFGQVRMFDPIKGSSGTVHSKILGRWSDFFEEYVTYYQRDNIKIPTGYKNQSRLSSIIAPFTLYLDSEKVLTLPSYLDITRYAEFTPELLRVYNELQDELIAEYNDDIMIADNTLVAATRLHQLASGYYKGIKGSYYIASPKVDETLRILDEIGGKPTVVYTSFESDVHELTGRLLDAGYDVKLLTGSLQQHVEFQEGDGDVLVANIAAGSVGVELTRARYAIFYSTGYSRTNYIQARGRIRRAKSSKPITYFHVLLRGSIDEEIMKAIKNKGKVSDFLLEGIRVR